MSAPGLGCRTVPWPRGSARGIIASATISGEACPGGKPGRNPCLKHATIVFMNSRIILPLVTLSSLGGLLGGCASQPESVLVTAPPPPAPTSGLQAAQAAPPTVVVAQAPVATAVPPGYVVMQAPPAPPPPEAIPPRPSSQHVWLAGYWTWRNNRYEWMAGRWEMPPHSGATWIAPRWAPEGGSYRFYEGHWK